MSRYRALLSPIKIRNLSIRNRLFTGVLDTLAVRWMQSRHVAYRVEELESGE